ncbi:hypothetical protein IAQ61_000758 [Plenodomus lingam]|nr:hypothetical protein IAQ61_000758 [Plenodomus lingam]
MPPTTILIVGAGAIGAFYASRLALAPNVSVSVICRSNYTAVSSSGFSLTSPQYGDYNFVPAHTFRDTEEARASGIAWDYIVVSTKALPDVSDDSAILTGLVGGETAIVLIQNGLGVEEPYRTRFPQAPICSAVTIASCAQPQPGVIVHNRWTRINSGPYLPHLDTLPSTNSTTTSPTTTNGTPLPTDPTAIHKNETFIRLLVTGGIKDATPYPHSKLQLLRWHKLAINASFNPSSVLTLCPPNHTLASDPESRLHLLATMHEILATAPKILGEPMPEDFASPEQIIASTLRNTSGSRPSMALDWLGGKRLEMEVILGNPIRMARERGLEMPRLQSLYALVRMAQQVREREGREAREERGGSRM